MPSAGAGGRPGGFGVTGEERGGAEGQQPHGEPHPADGYGDMGDEETSADGRLSGFT